MPYTLHEAHLARAQQQRYGKQTARSAIRPTIDDLPSVPTTYDVFRDMYRERANQVAEQAKEAGNRTREQRLTEFMAVLETPRRLGRITTRKQLSMGLSPRGQKRQPLYVQPLASLRNDLPQGWAVPPTLSEAIDEFEERQQSRRTQAFRALDAMRPATSRANVDDAKLRASWAGATASVARNRLFPREYVETVVQLVEKPKIQQRAVEKWNLNVSVWQERANRADSKDFYDTQRAKTSIIETLWDRALRTDDGRLALYVLRNDDGDEGSKEGEVDAAKTDMYTSSELRECGEVLVNHADLIWTTYDYYSVVSLPVPLEWWPVAPLVKCYVWHVRRGQPTDHS